MIMRIEKCFTMKNLVLLYRTPTTVRAIKSKRLRWATHIAKIEEDKSVFKIVTCKPRK